MDADITQQQVWMHAVAWTIAFAASVARLAVGRNLNGFSYCLGVGATGGFLALSVVTLVNTTAISGNPFAPFGISAAIGLLGKDAADALLHRIVGKVK